MVGASRLKGGRAGRYWLVSFQQRWDVKHGFLGIGVDLEPALLEQKEPLVKLGLCSLLSKNQGQLPLNPGKAKKRLILGSTFEVVLLPCFWLFLKGIIKEELFSGPKQETKRGLINIAIWWLPGRQFLDPVAQFWPSFSIPKLCAKLTKCP